MNMNRKYYEALYAYFKENQEEEILSLTYLEGKRAGEKYLVKASSFSICVFSFLSPG